MNVSIYLTTMDDSVTFINSVVDGTHINENWTLDNFKIAVTRNKEYLEKGLLIQEIIDDSSDKTPYTNAISAANTYLET